MNLGQLVRKSETEWWLPRAGKMRVPGILFATEDLLRDMDDKVAEQVANVAALPGIVTASYAMPDAHWGYGFPIGGVAAFAAEAGGVVSAGGVGFDISCGVRTIRTGLAVEEVRPKLEALADTLFRLVPCGVGSASRIRLGPADLDDLMLAGAGWAVAHGHGEDGDLAFMEERGCVAGARPDAVSAEAKHRQRDQLGTLGSGNHYLEVQAVAEIHDEPIAAAYGLRRGDVVLSVHCGSRGLGHQIGTDYLKTMLAEAKASGIELPERELACAPLDSRTGRAYLGAMRAAINCAMANREVITQFAREAFAEVFPSARLTLLYDVSHNTCKEEIHDVDGSARRLFVHRKGATRAFGPGHPDLPEAYRDAGQPVLIGGSMGTASYVLAGICGGPAFASAVHGAGRVLSRHAATRRWQGKAIVRDLGNRGIVLRSPSMRGLAEEAPGAYKDIDRVIEAAADARLARKVAKLIPLACAKG
ncbi:MAG: RtcB family protein [Deltaproteobacteria bacterium]|nr:RtcB family protein [Deltaproteobacteria bacterium]